MDPLLSTILLLGLMGAVVFGFRRFIRAPRGLSERDAPALRTVAVFFGDDPEFLADDRPDEPFMGARLFRALCDGLASRGVEIENPGTVPNAHCAECVLGAERFALVFERHEPRWVAGIEWVPDSAAARRHMALTHRVYAPPDSPGLRQLLRSLDEWLKSHPKLSGVQWHRKEKWLFEDASDPADSPIGGDGASLGTHA